MRELLNLIEDVEWLNASRSDECCGFGGTFAVNESDVSAAMGCDRIVDHVNVGSEVIVAGDMSCLMHLQGLIRRQGTPIAVTQISQFFGTFCAKHPKGEFLAKSTGHVPDTYLSLVA